MMLDWQSYRGQLAQQTGELGHLSPDTVRGYRGLSQAGEKSSFLGTKVRELIALAVGVTRQCDGCIAVHTNAAIDAGAALGFSARVKDAVSIADAALTTQVP